MAAEIFEKYVDFVKQNVEIVSEIEVALKWMSYFIAGRGKQTSSVLSELVYSASSVITLLNDIILRQSLKGLTETKFSYDHCVRLTLTLVEYLEVFAEISSDRLWGTTGKWIVITIIQVCKAAFKLFLMVKHNHGIFCSPPVTTLTVSQRKYVSELLTKKCSSLNENPPEEKGESNPRPKNTLTLKRSGRIMRTVSSAPPVTGRTWKLPIVVDKRDLNKFVMESEVPTLLNNTQVFAEVLHILRPIVHLSMMISAGPQSWSAWLIACGIDITSLRLLDNKTNFNHREKGELRFRALALLYFLLRSPFYDKFTKRRLYSLLEGTSNNVPLARLICKPILDYLPVWQNIYFYSWGS